MYGMWDTIGQEANMTPAQRDALGAPGLSQFQALVRGVLGDDYQKPGKLGDV
jgi:hypothetical protein